MSACRMQIKPYLSTCTKLESVWIKDLKTNLVVLFTISRSRKQPRSLSAQEWMYIHCSFTEWNTIQLFKKQRHHEFCRQMNGRRKYNPE